MRKWASQVASAVKNLPANRADVGDGFGPWVRKVPWSRKWHERWPEKFHEQKNPVGYSPWGCKEPDTTERMNTHTHMNT